MSYSLKTLGKWYPSTGSKLHYFEKSTRSDSSNKLPSTIRQVKPQPISPPPKTAQYSHYSWQLTQVISCLGYYCLRVVRLTEYPENYFLLQQNLGRVVISTWADIMCEFYPSDSGLPSPQNTIDEYERPNTVSLRHLVSSVPVMELFSDMINWSITQQWSLWSLSAERSVMLSRKYTWKINKLNEYF